MALTITPGWDFGATDRPTRETLLQQAIGLQITGIPIARLNASVLVIAVNDSTSASNLPADGSMWVDAQGSLWGRNKFGNVKVRRYRGGLETNRLLSRGDGGGGTSQPGKACKIAVAVASGTNITEARLDGTTGNGSDLTVLEPGINQETIYSSATTYHRFAILGSTRMLATDFAPAFSARRMRLYQHAPFSNDWTGEDHDSNPGRSAQAESVAYEGGASNVEVSGLFFGLPVRKA